MMATCMYARMYVNTVVYGSSSYKRGRSVSAVSLKLFQIGWDGQATSYSTSIAKKFRFRTTKLGNTLGILSKSVSGFNL